LCYNALSLSLKPAYHRPRSFSMDSSYRSIRFLVWLYFWLLLFEGVLRKWVFPSLSGPLLIVRDPVVLAIYALAIAKGIFPLNRFVTTTVLLGIVSGIASCLVFDRFDIILFGLRTNFLHLPLIFIIARVWNLKEVERLGAWILLLALPMTLLVVVQFQASQFSILNVGAAGQIGGQMIAATTRVRPSGTFSFVTGMVSFLSLVAAFIAGSFFQKTMVAKWLRIAAIPALILCLVVSGSRSAVAEVIITLMMLVIICVGRLSRFRHVVGPVLVAYGIFLLLSFLPVFREGLEVQEERFRSGGGIRHGIIARYLGSFGESTETAQAAPLFGNGLGIGTNAGAAVLTGSRAFLLGESEWSRVVAESGPLLGYAYLMLRCALAFYLVWTAWLALKKNETLSLLLAGPSAFALISGQFGQPTTLGFAVLTSGLALAAIDRKGEQQERLAQRQKTSIRGRSVVAERILTPGPPAPRTPTTP
jgi:hypothetical protein